ncbi:hypothetical protein NSQ20_05215 [Paenibacillus sp. FSL K6-1122]|uniref:hypothetical protein n=1 Tax=unclassified Paenibacillus TaxID=185978 RepID=UPI000CB93D24|nr:hypothetical protein [Paenibacillus sp. FSL R5-0765]PJN64934.1 hypothetical protein PAEAM_05280 [Paenibacillus sp. GM1FR]
MKRVIAIAFFILSILELVTLILIGKSMMTGYMEPSTFRGIISFPLGATYLSIWMFFSRQEFTGGRVAAQISFTAALLTACPLVCLLIIFY